MTTRRPSSSSTRSTGLQRVDAPLAEQVLAEARAIVVVAHDPQHRGAQTRGEGLDELADRRVGVGFTPIGEVAREHECVGTDAGCLDRAQRSAEPLGRVDAVEEARVAAAQVGVAEVKQHALGRRIFRGPHDRHPPGGTRSRSPPALEGSINVTGMFRSCTWQHDVNVRETPTDHSGAGDADEVLDRQLLAARGRRDTGPLQDSGCLGRRAAQHPGRAPA